jgi:multidrug efflux pump subunit AcrA (membrane-fusion protein)
VIDQSNLKAPGWQRIVAELLQPAPDDRTFLIRLLAILAQTSSAKQAVLFAVERENGQAEPRAVLAWPPSEASADLPPIESASDARNAARAAGDGGSEQVRVFSLQARAGFYGEEESGYIIAAPLREPPQASGEQPAPSPRAVITLLLEPRSKQAMQSTVAMVEVIGGYTHLHAARSQLARARASTASVDLAARLIASINDATGFKGACLQLVNDLCRQVRADRVAMGWVRTLGGAGAVRAVAMSDTENLDRRMAMVTKIEAAMEECLDQEQAVLYPPPAPTDPGAAESPLAQAITHAHRELGASDARLRIVSIPLRHADAVAGVVTIESSAPGPADISSIELIQAAMDLVAPVLLVRESDDRPLYKRAHASALRAGEWLVGPRHTGWKLVGVALVLVSLLLVFVRTEYRVEAPVEVQPRSRVVIAAPFDGVVASLVDGVAPGKAVHAGDVLATMDTREANLRLLDFRSKFAQARKEADAALKAGNKQSEVQQAQARAAQAQAGVDRALLEIEQARIVSPIDGTIIVGDLNDKVGASTRLGDPLFQVAPLDDMLVVARLSDRDIALVRDQFSPDGPSRGALSTRADPGARLPFTIERIVPLAQSKDGKNTFEVRGRLDHPAAWLRPGMEGFARFDAGRHSLLYIGTRRIRDQLRLWLWW